MFKIMSLLATLAIFPAGKAQTIISQMGPVSYMNSLDSARSASLNKLARRCYCMLQLQDSGRSIQLKMDVSVSADTLYYQLGYDNLAGNYLISHDSSSPASTDIFSEPGLYIKARDTAISEIKVLILLDYGIHHYEELKPGKNQHPLPDNRFITELLMRKTSMKFDRLLRLCK